MGKPQLKRKKEGINEESRIPLCRSDFLQDVTIALGRRSLKWIRKSNRPLIFEVSEETIDDTLLERLDTPYLAIFQLCLRHELSLPTNSFAV